MLQCCYCCLVTHFHLLLTESSGWCVGFVCGHTEHGKRKSGEACWENKTVALWHKARPSVSGVWVCGFCSLPIPADRFDFCFLLRVLWYGCLNRGKQFETDDWKYRPRTVS